MTKELNEKKFFIIEKHEVCLQGTLSDKDKMFDLTTAIKKVVGIDTLNEDRGKTSYHLQEVNFNG